MWRMDQRKPVLQFGVFEADLETGELYRDGLRVPLQQQPFRVLAILLTKPGELVTREELRYVRTYAPGMVVDVDRRGQFADLLPVQDRIVRLQLSKGQQPATEASGTDLTIELLGVVRPRVSQLPGDLGISLARNLEAAAGHLLSQLRSVSGGIAPAPVAAGVSTLLRRRCGDVLVRAGAGRGPASRIVHCLIKLHRLEGRECGRQQQASVHEGVCPVLAHVRPIPRRMAGRLD